VCVCFFSFFFPSLKSQQSDLDKPAPITVSLFTHINMKPRHLSTAPLANKWNIAGLNRLGWNVSSPTSQYNYHHPSNTHSDRYLACKPQQTWIPNPFSKWFQWSTTRQRFQLCLSCILSS